MPLLTHTIIHHSFADDLQLQISVLPDKLSELLLLPEKVQLQKSEDKRTAFHSMQPCISDVKAMGKLRHA